MLINTRLKAMGLALILSFLVGCHSPEPHIMGYQQTEDYTCGPAIAMSLLHYYDKLPNDEISKATEMKISAEMGTSAEVGTSPEQLAAWLKTHGFTVETGRGGTLSTLRHYLDQGIPVMVEWIDWGGHWVIATRYEMEGNTPDPNKDSLYLSDSMNSFSETPNKDGITKINAARFNDMWFDAQYFEPGHIVRGIYIIATPTTFKVMENTNVGNPKPS